MVRPQSQQKFARHDGFVQVLNAGQGDAARSKCAAWRRSNFFGGEVDVRRAEGCDCGRVCYMWLQPPLFSMGRLQPGQGRAKAAMAAAVAASSSRWARSYLRGDPSTLDDRLEQFQSMLVS